jgi:hypothetical protein
LRILFHFYLEGLNDMKVGIQRICLVTILSWSTACISCIRSDSAHKDASAKPAKPAAEESFDFVMETFRRRMEDTPIGFVVSDGTGRSTLTGTNKVSYELIRPATPSDPYKAIVTVVSRSSYSIKRTKVNPQDEGRDKNSKDDSSATSGDDAKSEFISANPNSQPPAEATKPAGGAPADELVARRPDEEVRKYELLYKDGRWVLTTQLNKETEQSIQNAFDSALAVQ